MRRVSQQPPATLSVSANLRAAMSIARDAAIARWNSVAFRVLYDHAADAPLGSIYVPNDSIRLTASIDPTKIEFKCSFGFRARRTYRLFQNDEWTSRRRSMEEIANSDMRYKTCREIVEDAMPIEETTEFKELLARIAKQGRVRGHFASATDVKAYLEKIAEMYEQVRREGRLRTADELGLSRHSGDILCAIGSDERLLMSSSGNHRFAVARLLKLKAPVRIGGIHAKVMPKIRDKYSSSGGAIAAVNAYLEDVQKRYG